LPQWRKDTKYNFCLFLFSLFSFLSFSQVKDTTSVNKLDEVLVSAIRVTTPVSFSNLDKEDIKFRNLGQDIPILMNYLPSVVTTSDAGNGVGYTGIRVRGSDATRVNVSTEFHTMILKVTEPIGSICPTLLLL
jgi:iron complex outermembrane receptor protein